jgi:putative methyltransferase (TIGR04325 family)
MKIPNRVPHLILNKVALWDKAPVVTMENFGKALVPYQIRNRKEFLDSLHEMGYTIIDEWQIDPLAHRISTHPELGRWSSVGFYMALTK